jgi:hypothetical protein
MALYRALPGCFRRATPEHAVPVDDLSESSYGKRTKVAAPDVKKVPAGLVGADGTFTISSTLGYK